MWKFVTAAKLVLWEFVEIAFLAVLALLLIFMLLGQNAGPYVASVADNVTKFATGASSGLLESCLFWRLSTWFCGGPRPRAAPRHVRRARRETRRGLARARSTRLPMVIIG